MMESLRARKIAGTLFLVISLSAVCSWPAQSTPQSGTAHKSQGGAQQKESSFVSEDRRFSAWMPGMPTRKAYKTSSVFGPCTITVYMLETAKSAYSVAYIDFPADNVARSTPDEILKMALVDPHKRYGRGIIKDEKITYHGLPGRMIVCRTDQPKKYQIEERVILVSNRLYHLSFIHPQSEEKKAELTRFMNSFKPLQ